MERIWQKNYPSDVPYEIDPNRYANLVELIEESFRRFAKRPFVTCMGKTLTYKQADDLSTAFGAYLQQDLALKAGDRIAIMMPNHLQYPIALFGAMKAGLVVVNTNPLYTPREMKHQFNDANVQAVVIVENFASNLEEILGETSIKHVILTGLGDLLGFPKSTIVNTVIRKVRKMVPAFNLPNAIPFSTVLRDGKRLQLKIHRAKLGDVALLQYTGGTTGVSKGAMLTHRNLCANMEQISAWMMASDLKDGEEVVITALPLYHIFAFTVNCLTMCKHGSHGILITNPRDIPGFIKDLKKYPFSIFTGVNTLFVALMNNPEFDSINFDNLKICIGGGMAVQTSTAQEWKKRTGCTLSEGYGLTEASPVLTTHPLNGTGRIGTIGLPVPSTDVKIVDDEGNEVPQGERGELIAQGPQVMKGYLGRPDATAETIKDGWLYTGDIAIMDDDGAFRIVDRKKDMVLVSGFNVYPNEIEDVVAANDKVLECACIGVPDEKSGEVVKVFVVKKDESLTEEELKAYCTEKLTGYKRPRYIEFKTELPKSNVGKILRRILKEEEEAKGKA